MGREPEIDKAISHDDDVAAAEFVLGTMDCAERAEFRRRLDAEPDLRRRVARWDERFCVMMELLDDERPAPSLRDRIIAKIGALPAAEPSQPENSAGAGAFRAIQAPVVARDNVVPFRSKPKPKAPSRKLWTAGRSAWVAFAACVAVIAITPRLMQNANPAATPVASSTPAAAPAQSKMAETPAPCPPPGSPEIKQASGEKAQNGVVIAGGGPGAGALSVDKPGEREKVAKLDCDKK